MKTLKPKVLLPTQPDAIKTHLEKQGYAVVQVLSEAEIAKLKNMFDIWFTSINPEISTDSWQTMPDNVFGIIKSYGVGQANFMWKARTNRNVQRVFTDLWGTSDLITSFDGACYWPASLATQTELWPHCDQHPKWHSDDKIWCIQGSLSLIDNLNKSDGGFVVWPRTHKKDVFGKWCERLPDKCQTNDFFKVPLERYGITTKNAMVIRAPAGCLIVWDSRLIHCNVAPQPSKHVLPSDRLVLYICMLPRNRASREVLDMRKSLFLENKTTSHNPSNPGINQDMIKYNRECQIEVNMQVFKTPKLTDIIQKLL
jgi:ectoine hydroxylase-related dioxygenase (phytanoyl-CoA dioxygenase family)